MKRLLLLSSFFLALTLILSGCSQERAANHPEDPQSAANANPAAQQHARDNGVKLGEKARDLEERTRPEREKLARETASAAEKLKRGALTLGDRTAATAQGVRQGWSKRGDGTNEMVDINSADSKSLQSLPGMTMHKAQLIMASRPYNSTRELVSKGLMSQSDYNRVKDRITASTQSAKK